MNSAELVVYLSSRLLSCLLFVFVTQPYRRVAVACTDHIKLVNLNQQRH